VSNTVVQFLYNCKQEWIQIRFHSNGREELVAGHVLDYLEGEGAKRFKVLRHEGTETIVPLSSILDISFVNADCQRQLEDLIADVNVRVHQQSCVAH
jgi:hypothetical protein